ncbi:MAG: sugar phosphate isomerase/epimerase [Chloroflexi bacterium]|nr:sugar phosphate isomerase/epimerase [Chloroflexota bacterium]
MIEASAINNEISYDFDDAVRVTADLGVRWIDIARVGEPWVTGLSDGEIATLRQTVRAAGLRVGSIDGPAGRHTLLGPAAKQEEDRDLRRSLELARTFEAPYVRIFSPEVSEPIKSLPRVDLEARLSEIVDVLRPWAEEAAAAGVTLTVETEGVTYTGTCAEMRRVIDAVGHPSLAMLWDVTNSWRLEGAHPAGYNHVRGLVRRLHLKGARLAPDNPDRVLETVPLADGNLPYRQLLSDLLADGFSGCAAVQTHLYSRDPDKWTKLRAATIAGLRHLQALLQELPAPTTVVAR